MATPSYKFTCIENTDIYMGQNNVQDLGFDKKKSFGEMIDIAIAHNCFIIIKNGKGKWYLKGQKKNFDETMVKLEKNIGKYPRRKCWILQ